MSKDLRKIPAIFDPKNERLFALQDGNKRLVFWGAQEEGPDEDGSRGGAMLKERAVGMEILPNGVVVGSCQDGSVFCATVDNDSGNLQVQYLPAISDTPSEEMQYAGSLISTKEQIHSSIQQSGRKRKSAKGEESKAFDLCQVYATGCKIVLRRHELAVSDSQDFTLERQKYKVAEIPLLPPGLDELSWKAEEPYLMPVYTGQPETVNLFFKLRNEMEASSTQYCCSIHLQSAELEHPPYVTQCSQQHSALINSKVLAMAGEGHIRLCDASNGASLHSEPLPAMMEEVDDWTLLSDPRKGHLILLASREGSLQVIKSTVTTLEAGQPPLLASSSMSLAARLSAALGEQPSNQKGLPSTRFPKTLVALQNHGTDIIQTKQADAVKTALNTLLRLEPTVSKMPGSYKPRSLVDAYENAVASLLKEFEEDKKSAENGARAIQMEVKSLTKGTSAAPRNVPQAEQVNGFHDKGETKKTKPAEVLNGVKSPSSVIKLMNGSDEENLIEKAATVNAALPLSFVDGATSVVVQMLLQTSQKNGAALRSDCGQVLHNLLETGKVLARRHLDNDHDDKSLPGILRALEGSQTKEERMRSPVDLTDDILRYCSDVSESQMVNMLHYMFCRSRPADIAFAFLDSKELPSNHPHKKLSFLYFQYADELEVENGVVGDAQEKFEIVSSKLVIAGSSTLLERILSYSQCNQALLCNALRDGLSFGRETGLLSRLLAELAFSRPSMIAIGSNELPAAAAGKQNVVKSASQWIPALFDAFGDRLENEDDESKTHSIDLLRLQESLMIARRQAEQLLALEDSINASMLSMS